MFTLLTLPGYSSRISNYLPGHDLLIHDAYRSTYVRKVDHARLGKEITAVFTMIVRSEIR